MADSNPFDPGTTNDLPDFVGEPDAPQAAPTPAVAEPAVIDEKRPLVDQQPAEITEEVTAPKVWAGKYENPEQLEKGYRELRELQRRTAERANAFEGKSQETEARSRQLEEALQRAIPYIQQAQQPQQQQQDPYSLEQPQQPQQPQVSQEMVDRLVQQRIGEFSSAQGVQAQQQQEYQAAESGIKGFFEKHPEIEARGTADQDVASTILTFNQAWGNTSVDLSSVDALEIAYEASQRPALRQVLEMNPIYFDTDEGLTLARAQASLLEVGNTQQSGPEPAARATSVPRSDTPVVERGSSQAPPQSPLDEFEQAVAELRSSNKSRGSDIFFGG